MTAKEVRKPLALDSPTAVNVLVRILTRGPIARIDVTRQLQLSPASVTKAVTTLMDHGLVTLAEDRTVAPAAPGRPARALRVVPESLLALGIAVQPGRLVATLTSLRAGVLHRTEYGLPGSTPETVAVAVGRLVRGLRTSLGDAMANVGGIGVVLDGVVGDERVRSGQLGWRDVAFPQRLRSELPDDVVVVANDVHALAQAEEWFGSAIGMPTFAVVSVGDRVRSALFANGGVVGGPSGDGALGRMVVGSAELDDVASTSAILAAVRTAVGDPRLGRDDALALARDSDPRVTAALTAAGTALGEAAGAVAALAGPELVLVTGDFVTDSVELHAALRAAFAHRVERLGYSCALVVRSQGPEDFARAGSAAVLRHLIQHGLVSRV
ncbi:ROK family protein [Kribbella sp. NPDC051770]|uniref:ROK family protein n=1 Tax=Kribbella sp. NPDC051770 TaxID=3155413 RepID=UPI00342BE1B9